MYEKIENKDGVDVTKDKGGGGVTKETGAKV